MRITREERQDRTQRVQGVLAGTNVLLALVKIPIGFLTHSPALVASGVEHVTDLFGNAVAWIGHRLARRPPDDDHHYGHGHFEALATVILGLLIVGGGASIVWGTLDAEPGHTSDAAGMLAVGMALLSAVVCEIASRWARRAAREISSPLLNALARDKRSDALTSIGAAVGIVGVLVGLTWAESTVAVLIGAWIALMGARSVLDGLNVLSDRVSDPGLRPILTQLAAEVPGVVSVQEVRVHPLGVGYRVDLEISVDGELSVRAGHEIAHAVESEIKAREAGAEDVQVHVNPA